MGHLTGSPKRLETGHIWLEIFGKSSYIYIYIQHINARIIRVYINKITRNYPGILTIVSQTECRTCSNSVLSAIIACNHLPFFKTFSNFVHFCPNFQIFCPFQHFFALVLNNCTHALTLQNTPWNDKRNFDMITASRIAIIVELYSFNSLSGKS